MKRTLAMLIVMLMLTTMALGASFSDIEGHWSESYVEDISSKGLVMGYEDGSFKPDRAVTNAETLAFVSRLWQGDSDVADEVLEKWDSTIEGVVPAQYAWAHDEFAICLELGVLSAGEFTSLAANSLGKTATRQDLAVWLVNAMGYTNLAAMTDIDDMDFVDLDLIEDDAKPHVALLSDLEIVLGDENGNYMPLENVTRGAVATMLSRSLDFMEQNKKVVRLEEFETYNFAAGTVTSVSGSILNIKLGNSTNNYTIADHVIVRENGIIVPFDRELEDDYVIIELDGEGQPLVIEAITPTVKDGIIKDITNTALVLTDGSVYNFGQTTKVVIDGVVGNASMIEAEQEYTEATVTTDASGKLLSVTLIGGMSANSGIFTEAYGELYMTNVDAVTVNMNVIASTDYYIDGKSVNVEDIDGMYGQVRYYDDGTPERIDVTTDRGFAIGAYLLTVVVNGDTALRIADPITGDELTYEQVEDGTVVYVGTKKTDINSIPKGQLVRIELEDGKAKEVRTSTGDFSYDAVVQDVTLGDPIVVDLKVGTEQRSLIMVPSNMPGVQKYNDYSSIDKVDGGDAVTVEYRDGQLYIIEVNQGASASDGVVLRIELSSGGYNLVMGNADGSETAYLLHEDCIALYEEELVPLTDAIGAKVTLTEDEGLITLITIDSYTGNTAITDSDATEVTGELLYINIREEYYQIGTEEGNVLVRPDEDTKYLTSTGSNTTFYSINEFDSVTAYGKFVDGEFVATLIIIK